MLLLPPPSLSAARIAAARQPDEHAPSRLPLAPPSLTSATFSTTLSAAPLTTSTVPTTSLAATT
eukprot:4442272-Prymnesium_polylepis.1